MFNIFKRKKQPFVPLYQKITNDIIAGEILTPTGNRFAKQSGINYKTGIGRFQKWEQQYGTIYLEDISIVWAEKFTVFLMQKGYCKNTIAVTLARLKAVLKRLYKSGISKFDGHGITATNESITAVYTTIDELRQMLDTDLSETPGFEKVRDVYIVQCFIGLRYSDLLTVLKNPKQFIRNEAGKKFIEVKTKKTGETVVIPMANIVNDIFTKYQYDFGNVFSYQYYNKSIKEIARRANIIEEVVFTRTEGGLRVDTVKEKCELISSHTARRTFATNAFLADIQVRNIMMITGHKTATSFDKYVRCTNLDAAIKIVNHPFFSIEMPASIMAIENINEKALFLR